MKLRLLRLRLAACAVLMAVVSSTAHAHAVDLFAYATGDEIRGNVAYSDGTPLTRATVEVGWNASGDAHEATVQTDDKGAFVFTPPAEAEYLFICRTPDGHRAARSVAYGGGVPAAAHSDDSIQQQLNALQEQLHAYERRTRIRDVLGGIGYILGLAGVFALVKSRRRSA